MYISLQNRMDILIIAATESEILPFIQLPKQARTGIDILVTGVGMVATAFSVGQELATKRYDLLLNVGIAGSFRRDITLGEIVYVHQDTFAELGVENGEQFIDSKTMGLTRHTFQGTPNHPATNGLRQCKGITVNKVHGSERTIAEVVCRLAPDIESMEGAAVYYAAHEARVPAVQVRAVSNYVERRNRANWQVDLAIENLNHWLVDFAHTTLSKI